MTTNYLTMTDAESDAYWDERHAQLARVNRRTWLYCVPLSLFCVAALQGALTVAGIDALPFLWAFLLVGIVASKVARRVAWRREGGKPEDMR